MLFIIVILLLILYRTLGFSQQMALEELWFMLCVFVGIGYVAGFLDSRIFLKMDENKRDLLQEVDSVDGTKDDLFDPDT